MSWFKKKKEVKARVAGSSLTELPELPELPRFSDLSELPEIRTPILEPRSLPSFPGKLDSGFSQEAIKSAVSPVPPINSKQVKNRERRTLEISEDTPKTKFSSLLHASETEPRLSKKIEPVYIRIDKFKAAIQSFNEIQRKVAEVEDLLQKIKEMKQKEDEELRVWERDLETIKARIDSIDKSVFSKLD